MPVIFNGSISNFNICSANKATGHLLRIENCPKDVGGGGFAFRANNSDNNHFRAGVFVDGLGESGL